MVKPRFRATERGVIQKGIYEETARKLTDNEQFVRQTDKNYGVSCFNKLIKKVKLES